MKGIISRFTILSVFIFVFNQVKSEPVRIALIGDPHFNAVTEVNPLSRMIIDDIQTNPSFPPVDFVMNLGDMTHYGSAEDWALAKKDWNKLLIPWIFVFGNHETANHLSEPETPYSAYQRGMTEAGLINPHYSFLYNGILFLIMGEEGVTHLTPLNQKNWLEFMTSQYPDYTTVIASHNSLYNSGEDTDGIDYMNIGESEWWQEFFTKHPQVKLFIHGHAHVETNCFNPAYGIQFINAPVTCTAESGYFSGYTADQCIYLEINSDNISARKWHAITNDWDKEKLDLAMTTSLSMDDPGMEWYSATWRVQDGQEIETANRMLAESYTLQVAGENDRELILINRDFEHVEVTGNYYAHWWGYDNAFPTKNGSQIGQIVMSGQDNISASTKNLVYNNSNVYWIEGKVPYSTVPRAIPGKSYRFSMRAKASSTTDTAMNVIMKITSDNVRNVIKSDTLFKELALTSEWQWYKTDFTLPEDSAVWCMKTCWETLQTGANCYLDEWSIERVDTTGSTTESFTVTFNEQTYNHSAVLDSYETASFNIDPSRMQNNLKIKAGIQGNRMGFVRLIYEKPILWSDDLSVGFNSASDNSYNIHLEPVSEYIDDYASISLFDNRFDLENSDDECIWGYHLPKQISMDKIPGDFALYSGTQAAYLQLFVTPMEVFSNGQDSALLICIIEDNDDILCPDATESVTFSVIGDGTLMYNDAVTPVNGVCRNIYYPGTQSESVKIIVSGLGLTPDSSAIKINSKIAIDDFENYVDQTALDEVWSNIPGLTASVSLNNNFVSSGPNSMQINYSIGDGSPPYSGIIRDLEGNFLSAETIHFCLFPDNSQRDLIVRLFDQNSRAWDYYIVLDGNAPVEKTILFEEFSSSTSTVPIDSCNWSQLAFYILAGNGGYGSSTFYIDDLEFRFASTSEIDSKDERNQPDEFKLYPNYPNPFNAQTIIRYYLPQSSEVTIEVYDILGHQVRTLKSDFQKSGNHQINFNAYNLATGIYFLKIGIGEISKVQKMLLVK